MISQATAELLALYDDCGNKEHIIHLILTKLPLVNFSG